MNQQNELEKIIEYMSRWVTEIELSNAISYFDINKTSENLALTLLNEIYDYSLINLNDNKENYPGIDLGDNTNAKIAFQVTSRVDTTKIKDTLFKFKEYYYNDIYTNGVKFLVLNNNKIKQIRSVIKIFPNFKESDIITPKDLIKDIKRICNIDSEKIYRIYSLLEKQFGQKVNLDIIFQSHKEKEIKKDIEALFELVIKRLKKRIDVFKDLFNNSWSMYGFGNKGSKNNLINKLKMLQDMDEDVDKRIIHIMKKIENYGFLSSLLLNIEEFLEIENYYTKRIERDIFVYPKEAYLSGNIIFHNILRDAISDLIKRYNVNCQSILQRFDVKYEQIKNEYDANDVIIEYSSIIPDKRLQFNKLLRDILDHSPRTIEVFFEEDGNEYTLNDNLWKYCSVRMLRYENGGLNEDQVYSYLNSIFEAFFSEGTFAPHVQINHIIFLFKVSENLKERLNDLKKRSNIKCYYFVPSLIS